PLALCNFVAYDLLKKGPQAEEERGKRSAIVALDIGTDSSNLVITDGAKIIWQRPIPLGGNHFTRALTKDLKLTFAKAEHLKRNAIKSPDLKKILAAIKPVLNDFVGEVQRSLGYFTNTHRDVTIAYMIGLGNAFRLPGLQRYLGEKLQLEVKKLDKMERLTGDGVVAAPAFTENILSFPVAYGLALQGLKQARLLTNLLPPEIRTERIIKEKKPWAVAAAAALLLAVGGMTWGFSKMFAAYGGSAIEQAGGGAGKSQKPASPGTGDSFAQALAAAKTEMDSVQKDKGTYKQAVDEAKAEGAAIESIVTGQKEQMNWLELSKFLDEAIPRPESVNDPTFLKILSGGPKPTKKGPERDLWEKREAWVLDGRKAFEAWQEWREGKSKSRFVGPLGAGIDHLFLFNIEAVSCRYTPNLKGYWENVQKKVLEGNASYVRPLKDGKNVPGENDKGWIIELRGYTYHEDGPSFLLDVLLDHIALVGAQKKAPWPLAGPPAQAQPEQPAPTSPTGPSGGEGEQPARIISHVVLCKASPANVTDGSEKYEDIGTVNIEKLLPAAVASTGGTPPGGGGSMGGMAGMSGGPGGGSGMAGMSGGPGGGSGGPMSPGPGGGGGMVGGGPPGGIPGAPGGAGGATGAWKPLASEDISPPSAASEKPKDQRDRDKARYKRTEFVVLFIWREPTDSSDNLLKKKEQPTEQSGSGGSGGPMPGSPMPGASPPPG
ncbi:MAG TPA: pilus assembly protein PilM, partial [Gemmataceae bacterium]|nr:pilus assembly protein PilM [Gemmataceae bacterium]